MKAYKYRSGSQRDIDTLKDDSFYSSSFTELNDPMECFFDKKLMNDFFENFQNVILQASNSDDNNLLTNKMLTIHDPITLEAKTKAISLYGDNDISDENKKLIKDVIDLYLPKIKEDYEYIIHDAINKHGIYSLSKQLDNELMWAHYSSNHTGLMIEYDLNRFNQNQIMHIVYEATPPKLTPEIIFATSKTEDAPCIIRKIMFGHKHNPWCYERETRIITPTIGLQKIPQGALTGIYFGVRMPEPKREEIMTELQNKNIIFYQMYIDRDTYQIKHVKLQ